MGPSVVRVVSGRGSGPLGFPDGFLGRVTIPKSGLVQSALDIDTRPLYLLVLWLLVLALSICFFQGQLRMLKPTQDLSPQPQISKETVSVASLNCLGKVVPMVCSSISKSWTQILFSWCGYAA